jgi:hypothetical protein
VLSSIGAKKQAYFHQMDDMLLFSRVSKLYINLFQQAEYFYDVKLLRLFGALVKNTRFDNLL